MALHIRLLLYGNINRGCILPSLHGYLTSLPPPPRLVPPSRPWTPHMETNLALKWGYCFGCRARNVARVKRTVTISTGIFPPSSSNPGLLFPWESQGLIWSSSVAAAAALAATVLKAKSVCVSVCVCWCVYSGYSSQQGSSSGGTQLVALQRSNPPPRTLWPPEPCQ